MNKNIKKKFLLDAWDYNQTLESPFSITYDVPEGFYYRNNNLFFEDLKNIPKYVKGTVVLTKNSYQRIVERDIEENAKNQNLRGLNLVGHNFIDNYFLHFFKANPELQLDLLKFYAELTGNKSEKVFDFISQFNKDEISDYLLEVKNWLPYDNENLEKIQELLENKDISDRVSLLVVRSLVDKNTKIINKTISYSSFLEDFVYAKYPNYFQEITQNIVAIQKRKKEVNFTEFDDLFKNNVNYCFQEKLNFSKIQKFFQIPNWNEVFYATLLNSYHEHLVKKFPEISISTIQEINNVLEVFVKMEREVLLKEKYKKDLFNLFSEYRKTKNLDLYPETIEKILLNVELSSQLEESTKQKSKIKI